MNYLKKYWHIGIIVIAAAMLAVVVGEIILNQQQPPVAATPPPATNTEDITEIVIDSSKDQVYEDFNIKYRFIYRYPSFVSGYWYGDSKLPQFSGWNQKELLRYYFERYGLKNVINISKDSVSDISDDNYSLYLGTSTIIKEKKEIKKGGDSIIQFNGDSGLLSDECIIIDGIGVRTHFIFYHNEYRVHIFIDDFKSEWNDEASGGTSTVDYNTRVSYCQNYLQTLVSDQIDDEYALRRTDFITSMKSIEVW